jgi:hypothetical protein
MRLAAVVLLLSAWSGAARGDESTPAPPAPACGGAMWRAGERAFTDYCRGRTGHGVHGSCADWLRAYRHCDSLSWEHTREGWLAVLSLFDCHSVVVELREEKGRWRVRGIDMRSLLPPPPGVRPDGTLDLDILIPPSPSPSPR